MAPLRNLLLAAVLGPAAAEDEASEALQLARTWAAQGPSSILQVEDAGYSSAGPVSDGSVPVVMMHGMGDYGANPMGMASIQKMISNNADTYVHSVELCSKPEVLSDCAKEDQNNGFFMTMDDQVDQFARVVRADAKLAQGFNAVGFSQGNTVIRGYIHRYNSPPVKTFISIHGVLMGVAGLPHCPLNATGMSLICRGVDALTSLGAYTSFVQNRLAQANYYRDPKRLSKYRKKGHFLPYINNEVKGQENATYAANFKALEKLVLVMAEGDTMIHPKESEQFGYYKDGSMSELVTMRDSDWYKEDWFGLRTLDEAKKIDTYSTPGDHLRFEMEFLAHLVDVYFSPPAADAAIVV